MDNECRGYVLRCCLVSASSKRLLEVGVLGLAHISPVGGECVVARLQATVVAVLMQHPGRRLQMPNQTEALVSLWAPSGPQRSSSSQMSWLLREEFFCAVVMIWNFEDGRTRCRCPRPEKRKAWPSAIRYSSPPACLAASN